ncbi:MAG: penicillin-binding transpeptidase domain-containing protein [Anaerotignaceae bacterium]
MKSYLEKIIEFIKSRLFLMLMGVFVLFSMIVVRLFSMQIVNGEKYQQNLKASILQELSIPASRGIIYDRYGRPLATNQVAFSLKLDDSIKVSLSNRNLILENLVLSYSSDDLTIIDTLPVTSIKPYSFTFSTEDEEIEWKTNIGLTKKQMDMTADEVMEYLSEKYQVSQSLTSLQQRKVISLGINSSDKNLMLLSLIQILDENGETLVDDLPISTSEPYIFHFDDNESKETDWKKSVGMKDQQLGSSPEQCITYLEQLFEVPQNLSSQMKRKIITIRYSLYLKRYRKYQPVTIALNISDKTVASVEEHNDFLSGVSIDTSSLRNYTNGKYFSHILGYIRKISDTEYEEYKDYGYTNSDIIGKSGIESLYELDLNGVDGEMMVEVDASGRRINTIETKQPVSGNNVFLTLDQKLQTAAYDYLEQSLTDVLISKLTATSLKNSPITLKEFFASMVQCNTINLNQIIKSNSGQQKEICNMLLAEYPSFSLSNDGDKETAQQFIINCINNNTISYKQLILVLVEQGMITADDEYLTKIQNGTVSPLSVVISKLRDGEITPGDTNLDPCSGSVVVADVNTGETLALVTYPSYDNNRLVNNFDNDYYTFLLENPTTPLVNRPLRQEKAPGSTFKMITALAALETGTITPTTLIQDLGIFKNAGLPYARCWLYTNTGGNHGSINVSTALEVSCNYFFYETAYRMGNQSTGNAEQSIKTLNKYMSAFGLDSYTGIEIGESEPKMASPEYKEETVKWQNPDATTSQTRWSDGDTIRAAIGQSVNNYVPSHMAKYISTLANGGTRYKMHIVDKVEQANGAIVEKVDPVIEEVTQFQDANLQAVYKGMLLVTQGTKGSLRGIFKDFPIDVAGKSGTAQENLTRSSHTWFAGFAPYDDPQIAVTVMIPFGENSGAPAAVVAKNIIAEYMGLNYQPENSYMDNLLAK